MSFDVVKNDISSDRLTDRYILIYFCWNVFRVSIGDDKAEREEKGSWMAPPGWRGSFRSSLSLVLLLIE